MAKRPPMFRPATIAHAPRAATLSSESKRVRGRAGQKMRRRRLEAAGWLCADCKEAGRVTAADEIDHIRPLALGGEDVDANCRALCTACHERRTAEQFGFRQRPTIGADGWPVE